MQTDGRSFYYADYNSAGRKVYSTHRFPCCSGTLPQVATDYGINAYLREPHGLYVNLYLPSSVRWVQGGAHCMLTQSGEYPYADLVSMRITAQQPREYTLYLRIPAWAVGARIEVNGARWTSSAEPGRFAALTRTWHDGDHIELALPRTLRLEAVDRRHPDTVALLAGPLVLFPIGAAAERALLKRSDLLAVRQVEPRRWQTRSASAPLTFLPYVAIDAEEYSTFLTVSA
jgi:DUF1680 family protein